MSVWTRTFYDRDCVADALVGALVFKHPLRKQHALFWAHELWVSEEYALLQKCLTKAFLQLVPFEGGFQEWKRLSLAESNILGFLGLLLAQPPLQKATSVSGTKPQDLLKRAVQNAEARGQTARLHILLEGLSVKEVTVLVSETFLKRLDADLVKVWRQTGKGLAWMLGVPEQPANPGLTVTWPTQQAGRLSARTFRTPKRKHPLEPSPFGVLQGCAAWQRILKETHLNFSQTNETGELVFETEEAEMKFYATYFPDDIPDEWPAYEKEKGHLIVG
jgi:hypothetical protein